MAMHSWEQPYSAPVPQNPFEFPVTPEALLDAELQYVTESIQLLGQSLASRGIDSEMVPGQGVVTLAEQNGHRVVSVQRLQRHPGQEDTSDIALTLKYDYTWVLDEEEPGHLTMPDGSGGVFYRRPVTVERDWDEAALRERRTMGLERTTDAVGVPLILPEHEQAKLTDHERRCFNAVRNLFSLLYEV